MTKSHLRSWLGRAQLALVSKNKTRKQLWTDFCELIRFEGNENFVIIPASSFTSISTFLQTEGRSDSLKDDSILNWITTLHDLRARLNEAEEVSLSDERIATRPSSRMEHKQAEAASTTPTVSMTLPTTTPSPSL